MQNINSHITNTNLDAITLNSHPPKNPSSIPQPTNTVASRHRFVKPPPATEAWQKVVRKEKQIQNNTLLCFFCQKPGHFKRNCWQRIKCHNCGNFGHKFAKCLYKKREFIHNFTKQNQTRKTSNTNPVPHKTTSADLPMEPLNNRPLSGDLFRSPTQSLNRENCYLGTMGLIILIQGSSSQATPRLIAKGMAEIHGGRREDYIVSQATIAPYVIICPSTQIRNQIVQRGLYSIPNTRTQFVVHE